MLKMKSGKKLRMYEEYAHLECLLSSKFTFLRTFKFFKSIHIHIFLSVLSDDSRTYY